MVHALKAESGPPVGTHRIKDGYCNEISQHDQWKLVEEELLQVALARFIGVPGSFAGQGRLNLRIDGEFQRHTDHGYHLHGHDLDNHRC